MATTIYLKNTWTWVVGGPVISGGIDRWDLGLRTITFLNRLATNVQMVYQLNAPAQMTGDVPSDDPEINIPVQDGDPFVSYNSRVLWGMRRENNTSGVPWVCRFAGVLTINEDEASSDDPVTHLTAHDPWMWANSLPVVNADGSLLGQDGLVYTATRADVIAKEVYENAITACTVDGIGMPHSPHMPQFIDSVSGHFDVAEEIDITFQQGCSVGEAWTQITDTGVIDIVLDPVYEPASGFLAILNVYNLAGSPKPAAIFSWDRFPNTLVGVDRVYDGTQMETVGQYYAGSTAADQATDLAAITKYGQYWAQKSFPAPASLSAVALVALADVALRSKGKRTLTVDLSPASVDFDSPQPSLSPWEDYFLGDQVPVWAGRPTVGGGCSIREPITPGVSSGGEWTDPQRIYAIPISLDDDQEETVTQLLMTDPND